MKKSKSKAQAKKAKKAALKQLKVNLVKEFSEVTAKFGKTSKKMRKTINKESKKFAKIISKGLKPGKMSLLASDSIKELSEQPAILPAKKVQEVSSPISSDSKPVRKRAAVKTKSGALPSTEKVKTVPVTRTKTVKKPQDPV